MNKRAIIVFIMFAVMIIGLLDRFISNPLEFVTVLLIVGVIYLSWLCPPGTWMRRLKQRSKKRKQPKLTVVDGYKKAGNKTSKHKENKKYYH